jgi:hypothetical protein
MLTPKEVIYVRNLDYLFIEKLLYKIGYLGYTSYSKALFTILTGHIVSPLKDNIYFRPLPNHLLNLLNKIERKEIFT